MIVKNNMKKVEELRDFQMICTYIFSELLKVCNENGLNLYLSGGSLLGAVRHKGFIPWDDDLDLCISRPNYIKLLEVTKGKIGEKCSIIDPKKNATFKGYIPLVVYNNSKLTSRQFRGYENLQISVSLFVYDGVPHNKLTRYIYYKKMYLLRAMHALCRANFKNVNTKSAKIMGPILSPFFNQNKVYKYKNKILSYQEKFSYEKSSYVSPNADKDAYLEVFNKNYFEEKVNIQFENVSCYTFSHYDEYLHSYYGEYMQLPKLKDRIPKHGFDAEIEDSFDYPN